jgi:hypothetical protein
MNHSKLNSRLLAQRKQIPNHRDSMQTQITKLSWIVVALLAMCLSSVTVVNAVPLISVADSSITPPAGGGGDSVAPVLSSDGRYVLFTSTANNLALTAINTPYRGAALPRLNVFLREPGATTLVSVNTNGTGGGNGDSIGTDISKYGLDALFESTASDLVPNDTNNCADVFVRDLIAGTTRIVTVATNGRSANGASRDSVFTSDGRYVAFVSLANNLVPDDTNGIADVFMADLQSNTMTLVSVDAMPTYSGGGVTVPTPTGSSQAPDISSDGRYVAFYSTATNLVPGVETATNLYVRDLVGGVTYWASADARSQLQSIMGRTDVVLAGHQLSRDGKYVAFRVSSAGGSTLTAGLILQYNLESGYTDVVDTNASVIVDSDYDERRCLDMTPDGRFIAFVANNNNTSGNNTCIRVWDGLTGQTTLASDGLGQFIVADSVCGWPTIDSSGRFVAFLCSGSNNIAVNVSMNAYHLYVKDMQAGTTKLISKAINGVPQGVSFTTLSCLATGGQYIAFEAPDGNLVPNDSNRDEDVFLHDLITSTTTLASVREATLPSLTPAGPSGGTALSVSADGRYVAFASLADNVALNDTNQCTDIFVRDVAAGVTYLVSVATNGWTPTTNYSTEASISADGRYVAFSSTANNLVTNDYGFYNPNYPRDVFVRDLLAGTTTLISVKTNQFAPNDGDSYMPIISADGQRVLFQSTSYYLARVPNLWPYDMTNLFYKDRLAGTISVLTAATNSGSLSSLGVPLSASMTPDGRWVAFITSASQLYVWDAQTASRVYTNSTSGLSMFAISPDGSRLAYATATELYVADWQAKSNWLVAAMTPSFHSGVRFSTDGNSLTYSSRTALTSPDTNATYDVYLYDLQTRSNRLVSHAYGSTAAANDASDTPDISPDGRFVAYRSTATNLVPGDKNGVADAFLYDRLTDATTLLSVSRFDGGSANSWSFPPRFAGDGRQAVFQSWASDLANYDFNYSGDVFAYAMFYADIVPSGLPASGPTLSWPAVAGKTYHVQYLDDLDSGSWQEAGGSVTIVDEWAYFTDPAPSAGQRFYRIVAN